MDRSIRLVLRRRCIGRINDDAARVTASWIIITRPIPIAVASMAVKFWKPSPQPQAATANVLLAELFAEVPEMQLAA